MYILIMVLMLNGKGIALSQTYFEDIKQCNRVAMEFKSHWKDSWSTDVDVDAFCIKGE